MPNLEDLETADTLVGVCATCYNYACKCKPRCTLCGENSPCSCRNPSVEEIDAQVLHSLITLRGLDWVLTELSAYAGRQAANACRAPGNRNLAAWGEARRLLHGVKLNISTLAQKKLPVARCLERATI
jgi:hypothetical protein